ncbi:MFS transporter [Lentzea rhizosphaerae]|uniref:MFS transporter n=1 Tax=Lentzea rhizosphaerae TaxID=2041025 RepID=A0ABV8BMJ0_9PSEU
MIDTRRRNLVVATVLLAMLLAALDQTIVSTALPTMVADLGGGAHLWWVVTSYLLAETVMTVLIGKFGDLYGRKKTFVVSLVLFLAGSFFAGWSESMGTLIALAATGLTLVTSWGGTEYPWTSPTILGMAAGSVVLLVAFVFVEQRAAEPMLPMRLFRSRVFTVSGVLSFVVGFAMLGGITYLPIYLQYVRGESATASGLWMLPLIAGLMATALLTGNVISRTGRYRIFPLAGSVGLAIGLLLLSFLDASTSYWVMGAFMVVLGAGIGLVMQVPVIVVQSTTNYTDLGVATSGISFLRTMGSSFGDDGVATLDEIAEMTEVPGGIFEPTAQALVRSGHLAFSDDGYRFTDEGADVFAQLVRAWRQWLLDQLDDWHEPDQRDFAQALDSFTDELIESGRQMSRV